MPGTNAPKKRYHGNASWKAGSTAWANSEICAAVSGVGITGGNMCARVRHNSAFMQTAENKAFPLFLSSTQLSRFLIFKSRQSFLPIVTRAWDCLAYYNGSLLGYAS